MRRRLCDAVVENALSFYREHYVILSDVADCMEVDDAGAINAALRKMFADNFNWRCQVKLTLRMFKELFPDRHIALVADYRRRSQIREMNAEVLRMLCDLLRGKINETGDYAAEMVFRHELAREYTVHPDRVIPAFI